MFSKCPECKLYGYTYREHREGELKHNCLNQYCGKSKNALVNTKL